MKRIVGLKFCGGCHPGYDRAAALQRILIRLDDRIALVPWNDPEAESILVICGCQSACAEVGETDRPVHCVVSEAGANATTADNLTKTASQPWRTCHELEENIQ